MFKFLKKLFSNTSNALLPEQLNGAYLVDVRSAAEFKSGSVKNAVNIPVDSIPSQISKFKGRKSIVVFCKSGMRASMAKRILQRSGFEKVYNGKTVQHVQQLLQQYENANV